MVAERRVMDRSSAEPFGKTDFAKVDAHVIQPHEYDELPEITDDMMERAVFTRSAAELDAFVKSQPPPTLRLEGDVAEALRATGSGWEQRSNAALREWLKRGTA